MGTNFYIGKKREIHIGKRSAAGLFCWDCGITLCKGGKKEVHFSERMANRPHTCFPRVPQEVIDNRFDSCPSCGKKQEKESPSESSGGKELGFNKQSGKKMGVRSCSSFSWAIDDPIAFMIDLKTKTKKIAIFDEYGRKISKKDFKRIIFEDCPIRYYSSIGEEFS